ncbi:MULTISPECIES: heterocyst-inhibiting protein PatX [unclassified Microcoleus]|uniref:heterocyst-inhibiting protein PatX n=1 Tax=unclassified Microcoleus TaxID=2642155 RepID=UPI002FD5F2B2
MQTYTPIALLSLLDVTLSATVVLVLESLVGLLEVATASYILSAQTEQRGDRSPERGSGRREFIKPNLYTHQLQVF